MINTGMMHYQKQMTKKTIKSNKIAFYNHFDLTSCVPSNPQQLWDKFKKNMSEDILYRKQKLNICEDLDYTDEIFNETLIIIED